MLRAIVESRLAFLISGGTGSGKTTLLAALLGLVDPDERLVLVEDASELRPDHPHVLGLEARPPNIEGAGEITLDTLVRQALRMRPTGWSSARCVARRWSTCWPALNTGHAGGAARFTPTRPATSQRASRRSPPLPDCPGRRRTASSRPPSTR